jgi:hypothetical protein
LACSGAFSRPRMSSSSPDLISPPLRSRSMTQSPLDSSSGNERWPTAPSAGEQRLQDRPVTSSVSSRRRMVSRSVYRGQDWCRRAQRSCLVGWAAVLSCCTGDSSLVIRRRLENHRTARRTKYAGESLSKPLPGSGSTNMRQVSHGRAHRSSICLLRVVAGVVVGGSSSRSSWSWRSSWFVDVRWLGCSLAAWDLWVMTTGATTDPSRRTRLTPKRLSSVI